MPGAFEELVELTGRQVYTLAYRLVGDRHEAEDVAQTLVDLLLTREDAHASRVEMRPLRPAKR